MNAHSRTALDLANAITGAANDTPMLIRKRLVSAIDRFENEDTISRSVAIDAIVAGRPVFWTTAKYHNAIACELLNEANRKPLEKATWIIPLHKRDGLESYLDTLVPLNRLAANELSEAYETLASTFRDCSELERRRSRRVRRSNSVSYARTS